MPMQEVNLQFRMQQSMMPKAAQPAQTGAQSTATYIQNPAQQAATEKVVESRTKTITQKANNFRQRFLERAKKMLSVNNPVKLKKEQLEIK